MLRLRWWAALVVGVGVFVAVGWPSTVQAAYPLPGRDTSKWYVCVTTSNSATADYTEPECSTLHWTDDYSESMSFDLSRNCGPGPCGWWYRLYMVPPVGVSEWTVTCSVGGFVNDLGLGAGSYAVVRGNVGTHTTSTGSNLGTNNSGLAFYTFSHSEGLGHDASSSTHDPYLDYLANGADSTGYNGWYVQGQTATSGTQVETRVESTCFVTGWSEAWVPPTNTPTPTPTGVPTSTPTPTPTSSNTATPTPTPPFVVTVWPTPVPWFATPEPPDFGLTPPTGATCYTLIPEMGPFSGTVFGYEYDFGWDYFELCVEEYGLSLSWWGINYALWASVLFVVASAAVLYNLFKQG